MARGTTRLAGHIGPDIGPGADRSGSGVGGVPVEIYFRPFRTEVAGFSSPLGGDFPVG